MNFFKRLFSKFTDQIWNIGIINNTLEEIIENKPLDIKMLRHNYKEGWFADPFVLEVSDNYIWLLVEELYYKNDRGRISKLTIDRSSFTLLHVEPVLQLNSHLSFPAIKRKKGKIFIYPENAKGEGLAVYEYDHRSNNCEFIKVVSNRQLADAIIYDLNGEEVIFATEIPNHNSNILNMYQINKECDIQLINQFVFPDNVARNAGDWFDLNGKVFRPAQDCNNRYGDSVVLQEVRITGQELKIQDIRRIKSTHWNYSTGCHTFNHYKDVIIVDCHGYKYPILGPIFEKFYPKWLLK